VHALQGVEVAEDLLLQVLGQGGALLQLALDIGAEAADETNDGGAELSGGLARALGYVGPAAELIVDLLSGREEGRRHVEKGASAGDGEELEVALHGDEEGFAVDGPIGLDGIGSAKLVERRDEGQTNTLGRLDDLGRRVGEAKIGLGDEIDRAAVTVVPSIDDVELGREGDSPGGAAGRASRASRCSSSKGW
jgi:hypothetical protein